MPAMSSQEIRLTQRPVGLPGAEGFELVTITLPEPRPGQIVVRNLYLSVAPTGAIV